VTVNAAAEEDDPGSVLAHYRRLIALRHQDPVITDGDFELLLPDHPAIWAFLRRTSTGELLVAANFSAEPVDVRLPVDSSWSAAPAVVTSHPDVPRQPPPDLRLRAWESAAWRLG
jgi:glycosidase